MGAKKTEVQPYSAADPGAQDGPTKKRQCRDVICLIFFFLYLIFLGVITVLAFKHGNMYRLVNGMDSWGNICGFDNEEIDGVSLSGQDLSEATSLFYFSIKAALLEAQGTKRLTSVKLCVRTCPPKGTNTDEALFLFANNSESMLCTYDTPINRTTYKLQYILDMTDIIKYITGQRSFDIDDNAAGPCPPVQTMTVGYISILNRCVPDLRDVFPSVTSKIETFITGVFYTGVCNDVRESYIPLLMCCACGLLFSIVLLVLFRFCAACIVWGLIGICLIGSLALTVFMWWQYVIKKEQLEEVQRNATEMSKNTSTRVSTGREENALRWWLVFSIIVTVLAAIVILVVCFCRKQLALVIQLFKEAGKAVGVIPTLLIQPLYTMVILAIVLVIVIYVFLHIFTAGHAVIDGSSGHVYYEQDEVLDILQWFYIFGIFWVVEFILACQDMVISGAVAEWYFTQEKSIMRCPLLVSYWRLIRYHLGSIAFGSLIIAIVKFIRFVLMYVERKLKGKENETLKFILKCLSCCMWLLEKFLKFLNKNAYIEIAMYGYSFCVAAKKAFTILLNNILRVAALNSVGDFILFLGKVVVTSVTAVVSIQIFNAFNLTLNFFWFPILLATVFAFIIAHTFLSVYETVIDTIFLCFCEDCERNDGSDQRPYHMSRGLMKFVENSKAAIKADKEREKRKKSTDTQSEAQEGVPPEKSHSNIYPSLT